MSDISEGIWFPISTIPRDKRKVEFLRGDEIFQGFWWPYWCGSDCPCDVASEGEFPFTDEPECWCAYRVGAEFGEDEPPTRWRPLAALSQDTPSLPLKPQEAANAGIGAPSPSDAGTNSDEAQP